MHRTSFVVSCALVGALGAGTPLVLAADHGGQGARPPSRVVETALPGLSSSPKADVVSLALPALHPPRGTVRQVTGPFDDRFTGKELSLRDGVLTGAVLVTSDVSEVIDIQVLVGFYDEAGGFLGSAAFERHGEDFADVNEHVRFRAAAPVAVAARAVSAAYGVTVLVNE